MRYAEIDHLDAAVAAAVTTIDRRVIEVQIPLRPVLEFSVTLIKVSKSRIRHLIPKRTLNLSKSAVLQSRV